MIRQFKIIDSGERDALRTYLIARSKIDISHSSTGDGWRSDDRLFDSDFQPAVWLRTQIYKLLLVGELRAWGIVNRYGNGHSRHRHRQHFAWSGVYYLDECDTATVFEMPEGLKRIEPELGLLVIFPIDLWHFVERHEHHEPRVTISFDAR